MIGGPQGRSGTCLEVLHRIMSLLALQGFVTVQLVQLTQPPGLRLDEGGLALLTTLHVVLQLPQLLQLPNVALELQVTQLSN